MGCELICKFEEPDFSETMFPKTREKLDREEYKKAMLCIAKAKDIYRYANLIDFLFCEIFVHPWREKCFRYYKYGDRGEKLTHTFKREDFEFYDNLLCGLVLEVCKRLVASNKEISWKRMRKQVFEIIQLQKGDKQC